MKLLHLLMISMLCLAIAGCGGAEVEEEKTEIVKSVVEETEPEVIVEELEPEEPEVVVEEPEPEAELELTDKLIQETKDIFEGPDKAKVFPGQVTLAVGEKALVGLGIKNTYHNKRNFVVKLRDMEAKERVSGSSYQTMVEDLYVGDWLDHKTFPSIEIEAGEIAVMPLIVTVGPEIKEGMETTDKMRVKYSFDVFWDENGFHQDHSRTDFDVKIG